MIGWLVNFFRPKKLYLVFNEEAHVGSFFCEAFYDRELAEEYIVNAHKLEVESQKELNDMIADLVATGQYPSELYDHEEAVSRLNLSIQEWRIPLTRKDASAVC